jgi:hypothetical protein
VSATCGLQESLTLMSGEYVLPEGFAPVFAPAVTLPGPRGSDLRLQIVSRKDKDLTEVRAAESLGVHNLTAKFNDRYS